MDVLTATDAPPLRGCTDLFGAVPGFGLCSQQPETCEFWTSGNCENACYGITGMFPELCWDDLGVRCMRGDIMSCTTANLVCLCNRIP